MVQILLHARLWLNIVCNWLDKETVKNCFPQVAMDVANSIYLFFSMFKKYHCKFLLYSLDDFGNDNLKKHLLAETQSMHWLIFSSIVPTCKTEQLFQFSLINGTDNLDLQKAMTNLSNLEIWYDLNVDSSNLYVDLSLIY